jgi:short subunit dehydrogenase-like uncharacterized protein
MAGRIVLFGATGYTGRLTAQALLDRGARPLLAGRNEASLAELANELGGDLEVATADIERPETVRALLGPDDVMLTTVGPFTHWGDPAIEAAIEAGVPYLDSTGEPPFVRRVFEHYGPAGTGAGVPLLTAMGYDWVPGNLAAALALTEAGPAATQVEIGYFLTGGGGGFSGGTLASTLASLLEPGFAFRDGELITEANGRRVRSYEVRGRRQQAVSASSSEHFAIPAQFGQVRDVEPFLGWFGSASRVLQASSFAIAELTRIGPAKAGLESLLARFARGSTGGPSEAERGRSGSHILAIASDGEGTRLAEVRLDGVNGYTFTAGMLAWAAIKALSGEIEGGGALGPAQAFGVEGLEAGVADAGINRL